MGGGGGRRFPASLALIGAGKMGGALLRGWLDQGLPAGSVFVIDPALAPETATLCCERGMPTQKPISPPDVMVLAVKPQGFDAAAADLASLIGPDTLVISIMAGKTIENIGRRLPAKAIVRAMPNLPASIGRGITAAVPNAAVSPAQRDIADALLSAVGAVEWLTDERLIDAVTAVSGSGPAYVFYLAECLAAAGAQAGLPADVARRLARATVEGSGELLARTPDTEAAALREAVTSPGGTTAAALSILMADDGLQPLMTKAVAAATRRGADLSG